MTHNSLCLLHLCLHLSKLTNYKKLRKNQNFSTGNSKTIGCYVGLSFKSKQLALINCTPLIFILPYPSCKWPKTCILSYSRSFICLNKTLSPALTPDTASSRIPYGGPCVIRIYV